MKYNHIQEDDLNILLDYLHSVVAYCGITESIISALVASVTTRSAHSSTTYTNKCCTIYAWCTLHNTGTYAGFTVNITSQATVSILIETGITWKASIFASGIGRAWCATGGFVYVGISSRRTNGTTGSSARWIRSRVDMVYMRQHCFELVWG